MANLNVPGGYSSISEAVAAASAGDTIVIGASYAGNESATVTVDDLTFQAPGSVQGISLTLADGVTTVRLSSHSDISVVGNGAANVILGNDGDNVLAGGRGDDHLDGGLGIDTASYASARHGVTVNLVAGKAADGEGGHDTLAGIENVRGSAFNDTVVGTGARNVLQGAEGNDALNGGGGNDELYGDDGDDKLQGGTGDDLLTGGAGNDTLIGGSGRDAVVYEDSTGAVTVNLRTGIATDGMGGTDHLSSIAGVFGSAYGDTLTLGNASGYAFGRAGDDMIFGGKRDDEINGGAGADTIDGGDGIDTVNYLDDGNNGFDSSAMVGVKVNLAKGTARDNNGATDTLTNIENVTGSALADVIAGDDGVNILNGGTGDDRLNGNAGKDVLYGGDGADHLLGGSDGDSLIGGAGDDTLNGGRGRDMAIYDSARTGVTVDLVNGTATDGLGGTDTLTRIESAMGGRYNDTIILGEAAGSAYGRSGSDTLTGGRAGDELNGGSGEDTIDGGAGIDTVNYLDDGFDKAGIGTQGVLVNLERGRAKDNWGNKDSLSSIENATGSDLDDTLLGDDGRNVLTGGLGNDRLNGGAGADYLDGGAGADTLVFSTQLGAGNVDFVNDFLSGTDHFELSKSIFSALDRGSLAESAFVQAMAATTSDQHILYNSSTGVVSYDADGNGAGAAVGFANVGAGQTLTASDFKVV